MLKKIMRTKIDSQKLFLIKFSRIYFAKRNLTKMSRCLAYKQICKLHVRKKNFS